MTVVWFDRGMTVVWFQVSLPLMCNWNQDNDFGKFFLLEFLFGSIVFIVFLFPLSSR